ncbi:MAG: DUF4147 domain-containing protein [Acidobacteriaceae bacterium]|nr:DUF4147 domain-containing protein [Acidobacteriaceae bacterium]
MLSQHSSSSRTAENHSVVLANLRAQLLSLFNESMRRIDITNVMTHAMTVLGGVLHIGKLSYSLVERRKVVIIAVGKAAIPMCRVAAIIIQAGLHEGQEIEGIAVGPGNPDGLPDFIQHFVGGHPLPNDASREAAETALSLLQPLQEDDLVLFLISGGASSMLEAPLSPQISNKQVNEFYRALVYSGLPITSMNTLRKHFSKVKGGRLAFTASPATQCTLVVSDVPDSALDMVGSGLSLPDPSTVADCRKILSKHSVADSLSREVQNYFMDQNLHETPFSTDSVFKNSKHLCLLSNKTLLEQVQSLARQAGFHCEIDNTCDDWHYQDAATYLLERLRTLRKAHKRVCLISGGELSVKLTEPSGLGGRNQHFALHCALNLMETDTQVALLSAGSDGVDGNSPAAGALVDSTTLDRARKLELDPFKALREFDSYSFFEALGDSIVTGPTGNNVRDLRMFLSCK